MTLLQKTNYHPRDALLFFDKSRHAYSTKLSPYLRSITKVIYSQFPEFDKMKISQKMENKGQYKGKTAREIREMWAVNGKEAREAGTLLHEQIEKYYNGQEVDADDPDFALDQFVEWDTAHENWDPFRTEWQIFDDDLKIAGTIDAVFKDETGQVVIVDWKRCKEIKKSNRFDSASTGGLEHIPDCNFSKYSMQLNLYKLMLEKNYDLSVSRMIIVNFHPNQSTYREVEAMDLKNELQYVLPSLGAAAKAPRDAITAKQRTEEQKLTLSKGTKGLKITGTAKMDDMPPVELNIDISYIE